MHDCVIKYREYANWHIVFYSRNENLFFYTRKFKDPCSNFYFEKMNNFDY